MNKSIEKLYEKSPIWFQNWMISLYGAKLAHLRYGNEYHVFLDYLKQRDVSNPQVQKRIQNQLFLDFLHYAVKNSPFYQDFYKDVDLNQIKSVEDITKLPILTKEILRQNIKKIYTINPKDGVVSHTGGTTGKSLQVFFTKQDTQRKLAYLDWFKSLHGFTMTQQRHARFNGKHIVPANQKSKIFWRDNKIIKQRIYSSFFTSEDNIPYYIENLNKYKPEEIDGFVSTMYEIARYMERHRIQPTFSPIAIFPTSETVLPMHRELLSRVFRCPIRDQYASSEGAPFIIEDELGYMHECIDTGVFEHIPSYIKFFIISGNIITGSILYLFIFHLIDRGSIPVTFIFSKSIFLLVAILLIIFNFLFQSKFTLKTPILLYIKEAIFISSKNIPADILLVISVIRTLLL